jgi:hypothetical protein
VFLNCNKGNQLDSSEISEAWLLNKLNVILYFLLICSSGFLKGINLACCLKLNQSLSDFSSPRHLSGSDKNLSLS